ncbi:hypothetical protein AMECASPLE_028732 [Ameca splendens]|uniref:Uncharacterized protein n=1 Tax=Ameca splendens TaxID=208324 RepID=A0ABV0XUF8_9TELE
MAVQDLLHQMSSITFEMKNTFSASQDLLSTRSKTLKLPETGSQCTVFSIKPIDFSMKLYSHLTVSQKNKKTLSDAVAGKLYKTKRRSGIFPPNIINQSPKKTDAQEFNTSHRRPDALQSQLMFVRMGKFPSDP